MSYSLIIAEAIFPTCQGFSSLVRLLNGCNVIFVNSDNFLSFNNKKNPLMFGGRFSFLFP